MKNVPYEIGQLVYYIKDHAICGSRIKTIRADENEVLIWVEGGSWVSIERLATSPELLTANLLNEYKERTYEDFD